MDEKLNIRSSFPMFKSPVKVKRLDKQNEEPQDRSFDRHLKKDRDKRKKKHREVIHHHNIKANKHRREGLTERCIKKMGLEVIGNIYKNKQLLK